MVQREVPQANPLSLPGSSAQRKPGHHSDLLLQGWGLLFFPNPLSHPALSSPSPCTGLLTLRQLAAFRAAGELGKESAQGGEEHRLVYSPVCALGRLLDLPRLPLHLQHRPKGVTAQTPIKCPKSALCTVRVLTGTAVLICPPLPIRLWGPPGLGLPVSRIKHSPRP